MKTLPISVILSCFYLFAVFPEESPTLSIQDFVGTYRLDRIENPWLADDVREEINKELIPSHNIFVIGEDYYVLGGFRKETSFSVGKIEEEGFVPMRPAHITYDTSKLTGLFWEIPHLFDSVFKCGGRIWVIEPLDYDTVVIHLRSSYLLYKRVK